MVTRVSEQQMMQSVWRKALRTGRHDVTLPTEREAARVRFALYNALKPIKSGKVVDEELSRAAEECTVRTEGLVVSVIAKATLPMMRAVLASLEGFEGLGQETKTPEQVEIERSQARLQELLGGAGANGRQVSADSPAPGARTTPYYSR